MKENVDVCRQWRKAVNFHQLAQELHVCPEDAITIGQMRELVRASN